MNQNGETAERKVWSREETEYLIELLRPQRVIWDISCADYRSHPKRALAFETISNVLGRPKLDVQKKLHNLRNQFNNEKRKLLQRIGDADGTKDFEELKSSWCYYEPMLAITPKLSKSLKESGESDNGKSKPKSKNTKKKESNLDANAAAAAELMKTLVNGVDKTKSNKRDTHSSSESDDEDGIYDLSNFNQTGFIKFKEDKIAAQVADSDNEDDDTSSSQLFSNNVAKNAVSIKIDSPAAKKRKSTPKPIKFKQSSSSSTADEDNNIPANVRSVTVPEAAKVKAIETPERPLMPTALNANKNIAVATTKRDAAEQQDATKPKKRKLKGNEQKVSKKTAKTKAVTTASASAPLPVSVPATQSATVGNPKEVEAKPAAASPSKKAVATAATKPKATPMRQRAKSICATALPPMSPEASFHSSTLNNIASFASEFASSDQYEIFGKYVASEMRQMSSDVLRRKMKRQIQETILALQEQDEKYQLN